MLDCSNLRQRVSNSVPLLRGLEHVLFGDDDVMLRSRAPGFVGLRTVLGSVSTPRSFTTSKGFIQFKPSLEDIRKPFRLRHANGEYACLTQYLGDITQGL
jgi:hypothetical protein